MQIFLSVIIGGLIGGIVAIIIQSGRTRPWPAIATGILGGLLGLVTDKWLGNTGLQDFAGCEYLAAASGAILALFLWAVAQRLFLADPPHEVH